MTVRRWTEERNPAPNEGEFYFDSDIGSAFVYLDGAWIQFSARASGEDMARTVRRLAHLYNLPQGNAPSDGSQTVFQILMTMFKPFVDAVHRPRMLVMKTRKDVFMKRFDITSDILDYIDLLRSHGMDFVLAGGKMIDFVNNVSMEDSVNDFDLWSIDETAFHTMNKVLSDYSDFKVLASKPHVTDWIDTVRDKKLQVVNKPYADVSDIVSSFDIRACAIAYDGEYIYWIKDTIRDIKDKRITIQTVEPRRTTFVRVEKYIQRGYHIDVPDLGLAAITFLGGMVNNEQAIEFYTNRDYSYLEAMELHSDYTVEE